MSQALAQITPASRLARMPRALTEREKAAVIVRLLIAEGADIPIASLPEDMQAELTEQMGQMRVVDRATLDAVIAEFTTELEQVGIAFAGGMEGALKAMDGHISADAASNLRRRGAGPADPWERLNALPSERLLPVLQDEAVEIAAVVLSKLPVARSAELLGKLPGERARRVAHAVSMTEKIDPATVRRIGQSLSQQLEAQPLRAFDAEPSARVGAILNVSTAVTRDEVLRGLEAEDAGFAGEVRKAIFTFAHIPDRLMPADVPKVTRVVDQAQLVMALSVPEEAAAASFILSNLSQRMAQSLRDEIAERGTPKPKDAEAAMTAVVEAIRKLEGLGEITLTTTED